jgi:integrase
MTRTREKNKTVAELENDEVFNMWFNSFDRTNTQLSYRNSLRVFCEFTGAYPKALIDEAREDYINRVPPWELRHVKRIDAFLTYLKTKNGELANHTKLNYIKAVKHFYTFNKIPVILNKTGIAQKASERYLDILLLKIEDIRKAVLSTGINTFLKAYILTTLSSGQGQNEVRALKGKHLKNIVNNVCIVNMTRGKSQRRYFFFIGNEALEAIKEYKPNIADDDFVFTQKRDDNKNKQVSTQAVTTEFERHSEKLGFSAGYFAPHRLRHYFKSTLTGSMDEIFIEYLMGHKLSGAQSSYFLGNQSKMLEQYIKNQDRLTVFTDKEVLQKQYDELKGSVDLEKEDLKKRLTRIEKYFPDEVIEKLK